MGTDRQNHLRKWRVLWSVSVNVSVVNPFIFFSSDCETYGYTLLHKKNVLEYSIYLCIVVKNNSFYIFEVVSD